MPNYTVKEWAERCEREAKLSLNFITIFAWPWFNWKKNPDGGWGLIEDKPTIHKIMWWFFVVRNNVYMRFFRWNYNKKLYR